MPLSSTSEPNSAAESANTKADVRPTTLPHGPIAPLSSLNISRHDLSCLRQAFQSDGFVLFDSAIDDSFVSRLQSSLEHVLRGRFDRGKAPDKMPAILEDKCTNRNSLPLGFHPNNSKKRVIQIINIHKCDATFREIATCAQIGRIVGHLAGWDSVRLAQDQVWAKPPGAPPLVFHRDSPYFMFTPDEIVTVWIALDHMSPELGPLEYVKSSHTWGDGRVGSSSSFFQSDNGKNLLYSAAKFEGIEDPEISLEITSTAGMRAGGLSIHNGRTWHGSGKNCSTNRPRRGLGLHFIHGDARFTNDARKSKLWSRYIPAIDGVDNVDLSKMELQEEDFPLVWKSCHGCA